ncbi:nucleotidyltransferase domain-containing protein [Candidatus Saganbacteria bacterium]|nr:nucleotidyltransferase domain-containing protein [Candidatus Saganbacteria bacterium]
MKTDKIDESLIKDAAAKIAAKLNPKKIILFGSHAWGKASGSSDLDLFIIAPSVLRRDERGVEVSKLFPDRLFPLDALVYTPEEVEQSLRRKNPFVKEILEKGKILYGA